MLNATGARLLIVDDDEAVRTAYARLLGDVDGVGSVFGAADGLEALQIGATVPLDVAVLDLNMPRLDGVTAATRLAALQPTIAIALHSSDPARLPRRARGLEFAVFDTIDFDGLSAWLVRELERRVHLRAAVPPDGKCSRCGYGIAVAPPPERCPMCNRTAEWTYPRNGTYEVIG
jgi:CheY-like chemotaxis protein